MKTNSQPSLVSKIGRISGILVLIYVFVYSVLSAFGSYQPEAVDVRGAMAYWWAPAGFYDAKHAWPDSSYANQHPNEKTGGWKPLMLRMFLPLFYVDNRLIHKTPPPSSAMEK